MESVRVHSFVLIRVAEVEQAQYYSLLSGILLLGNIEFEGEEEAKISSPPEVLTSVAELLGIEEKELNAVLTHRCAKL